MITRFFLVASTVGATFAAHAADLAVKAPIAPSAYSWTGSYGGIAGGYGWGHSDQTDSGIPVVPPLVPRDGSYPVRGGLFGGTLGYNWQQRPWVLGLEGDLSWADITGHSDLCGPLTATPLPCGTKLDALGTFRGRAGIAVGAAGNWLLYATGGLAVGRIHGWDALTPASGDVWRAGWTVGAGIETTLAPNWTAKLEYLYVDFGNAQVFNVVPGVSESVGLSANILRAGINYRFGDQAPPPQLYTRVVPMAAGNIWSGWYAGLNAGYVDGSRIINTDGSVFANSTTRQTAPAMAAGATSQLETGQGGFLGGVQFGYNTMLSPLLLAGFEADIQGSSLRGSASTATSVLTNAGTWDTSIAASRSLSYLGTIRARVGATVTPNLLLYVTGGLAYGGVKSSTTISQANAIADVPANTTSGSFSDNRAGYTVGGGGEWMFLSKWSLKAEYLYYDLGSANYGTGNILVDEFQTSLPGFGIAAIGTSTRVHFNGNIARVGLNYHLN